MGPWAGVSGLSARLAPRAPRRPRGGRADRRGDALARMLAPFQHADRARRGPQVGRQRQDAQLRTLLPVRAIDQRQQRHADFLAHQLDQGLDRVQFRNSFSGTARRRSRRSICSPVRWVRSKRRKGLFASTWRASLPGAPGGRSPPALLHTAASSGCWPSCGRPRPGRRHPGRRPRRGRPARWPCPTARTSSFGCAFFRPDTTLDSVPMQDTMLPTDTEPASSPGAVRGRRRRSYMSSNCLASGSSSRPAALRMASRPLRSNSSRPSSVSGSASGS